ncbi:long-chain acyl-CoA synthetase [Geodermatophilus saharensis]|uniref:Long-chain acyl-CoA synthetase n=1 Tax=Geodermatophilus saharensis TaxID=1137994 RepID=A0A239BST2_9ACTN|nr:long-chain fatty acid--CoA ligase [Geodermatophilus saharensis]SNS10104.1 long-chain acyl-CoA synthetase [Geodermatophilus saharensis]
MSFNLATILRESALTHPDKPMLLMGPLRLTYRQVDVLSGQVAAGLRAAGLRRGDSVALQLPNVPQFVLAYFGALKAGLTLVPLNPLLKAPEVAYHLSDSGAKALITVDAFADEAVKGAAEAGEVRVYVVASPGAPADSLPADTTPFDTLVADGEGADPADVEQMSPEDTAVVIYTSGTTGRPKGAELTHFQAYMAASVAAETFAYRDDDVAMAVLPLFHVFGLSSVMNCAVRSAATLVLVPRFEVGAVLDAMEQHRVTVFCGVPTMFVALMHADLTGRDVSSLRICVSGGASIPGEVIKGFEAAYAATVLEGYGLSETCAVATFNRSAEERRVMSIGKRLWGCEVRVVDPDDAPLPTGPDHVGEIVLRGHNIMKGYLGRPEATAEAMRGGWFHTGDLGYQDDDGFFYIVDRKKDLVIRGGFNVYPREIEEVLHAHPAVLEAAVIGRPDERLGEEVVAFVSLKAGASAEPEEVIAFCRERLAAYKYPRQVVVIDELPKGPSGKVLKTELRSR